MSCKYNNSMYTTTPPMEEFPFENEIYPIEEINYAELEQELLREGWI